MGNSDCCGPHAAPEEEVEEDGGGGEVELKHRGGDGWRWDDNRFFRFTAVKIAVTATSSTSEEVGNGAKSRRRVVIVKGIFPFKDTITEREGLQFLDLSWSFNFSFRTFDYS
ncbi:hypothetical protein HAX54_016165 [Datura stramonium]|uniref:Uncharacterized protein n=1 Tax=Datura stramonium TaxID=4076 RepID=A0ABS8S0E6_DATST|nr:hypothetical protein [Datura stramonium]